MTGPQLLITAIIVILVIAFIITVVLQNVTAKGIISSNSKLVENQNTLLLQNKMLTERLKESEEALETAQQREDAAPDGLMMLREQTRQHREHIRQTTDMTDAGAPARYHSTGTTLETRM